MSNLFVLLQKKKLLNLKGLTEVAVQIYLLKYIMYKVATWDLPAFRLSQDLLFALILDSQVYSVFEGLRSENGHCNKDSLANKLIIKYYFLLFPWKNEPQTTFNLKQNSLFSRLIQFHNLNNHHSVSLGIWFFARWASCFLFEPVVTSIYSMSSDRTTQVPVSLSKLYMLIGDLVT